jgi:hypothetical protein
MSEMYGQLNKLRQSIMNKAMTNMDMLKFIYYCNEIDILKQPELTSEQREELLDNQIFKYRRMPLINQTEGKCYLSMDFLGINRKKDDPYFMQPIFEFSIVCSDSIVETLQGSRILAIEDCIVDTFDMQYIGTIGYVKVLQSTPQGIDTGFQGRKIQLFFTDWIDRR